MNKIIFEKVVWIWIIGWIPTSLIVGYIIFFLKWHETVHPLIDIVITSVIFLLYAIPLVRYLEKKKK